MAILVTLFAWLAGLALLVGGDTLARDEPAGSSYTRFARCAVSGEDTSVQVLEHVTSPDAEASPESLSARSEGPMRQHVAGLLADRTGRDAAALEKDLTCKTIDAPVGDVDYEILVSLKVEEPAVDVVNVGAQNALALASSGGHCASDSMGNTFCAHASSGVAVRTTLGEIHCARGQCVKYDNDFHCARRSGGWAEITPRGPQCDGGCYYPSARQCRAV